MKNPWKKSRKFNEEPYYKVMDNRVAFYYEVFKVYGDPRKPYARALCRVVGRATGPNGDLGDVYATEVPGLVEAWLSAVEAAKDGE